jgi:stearoyl-CoA desaturase (delta-9 desaturase)
MDIQELPSVATCDEMPVGDCLERAPLSTRVINLLAIVVPFAGVVAAIALTWGWGWFSWAHLALLVVGYVLTGLGITVGYHRLFTHKSFETGAVMKAIWGVLGSMAVEGPIIKWVATHRSHHQHSDREDDPHSPNTHGAGVVALFKGLYHAHFGWLFARRVPNLSKYVPDLEKDRLIKVISALFPLWVLLGLAIPTVLGWAITGTWKGALLGLIWGGLVRIFLVHHVTWSINSVCHLWGYRAFNSHDHSRNNPIFGILGMGEGWHNNHHAFPASARHGLRWWEIDLSYLVIRGMELLGLAQRVRVPSRERIEARMRQ